MDGWYNAWSVVKLSFQPKHWPKNPSLTNYNTFPHPSEFHSNDCLFVDEFLLRASVSCALRYVFRIVFTLSSHLFTLFICGLLRFFGDKFSFICTILFISRWQVQQQIIAENRNMKCITLAEYLFYLMDAHIHSSEFWIYSYFCIDRIV